TDYRISPVHGELEGLPPVLIEAGELEFLRDHPQMLASAANTSGAQISAKVWAKMGHAFQVFGFLPDAKTARREACEFLLAHISTV
ncbi:MAG: alpha/beta hydrolase, partial [Spongiibacteraceae bacterium]